MNDFHSLIKQRYGEAENIKKDTTFSESNTNAYRELKQPPTPTPPQPDSDDYWETYGYTDKDERQGRGGGRGGKHHPEHHGPATRNAIARNQRENAERNRGEEARINILICSIIYSIICFTISSSSDSSIVIIGGISLSVASWLGQKI